MHSHFRLSVVKVHRSRHGSGNFLEAKMGDTVFKTFFFGLFAIIGLVGLLSFLHMEKKTSDRRQEIEYIQSRGASKMPSSWRGKIGQGI